MKQLKEEKGSITLFVLVSMLFFVLFLTGAYMLSSLGQQTGISETAKIKEIYEKDMNRIDDIYATLVNKRVYYVNDKEGNKIPVPNGFSPITTKDQGTKETGFVIKNDTDGNEYVWVPVDDTTSYQYARVAFTRTGWKYRQTLNTTNGQIKRADVTGYVFKETMPKITENVTELQSVTQFGGFYIGRYETGIIGYDKEVMTTNSGNKTSWTGYTGGTAVVQKEKQVWNYITRDKAREVAEGMYTTNGAVISRLCSSYAWDTTLRFIETKHEGYATNSEKGNYSGTLQLTGQSTPVNNIYDMGGNVYEITSEVSTNSTNTVTLRGGTYYGSASSHPAALRSVSPRGEEIRFGISPSLIYSDVTSKIDRRTIFL